jgi:hypothetical protein
MKKKICILISEEQENLLNHFGFSIPNFLRACLVARIEPGYYPVTHSRWKIIELESSLYEILFEKSMNSHSTLEEYSHFLIWELIYQLLRTSKI